MKKKIFVVILIVVLVGLLLVLFKSCDRIYEASGSIEKGYKYLEQGKYDKAKEEFDAYQENLPDEVDYSDPEAVEELVKMCMGFAKVSIGEGLEMNAAADIYMLFDEISDEMNIEYAIDELKELARWYLLEYCDEADVKNYASEFIWDVPELEGYIEMDTVYYEKTEPYNKYYELYIDGKPTGRKKYTGTTAKVTWVVEGYEDKEPYKEFERKYIEDEPTDEIRYTGKTKPKANPVKRYPKTECPYCGYSAASDPNNHPGHGLEGLLVFERGQNSDGSWGFYYVYGETDYGV